MLPARARRKLSNAMPVDSASSPCFVRDASNLDSPLRIVHSEQYGKIVQKSVGTTYPSEIYYDHAFDSNGYGTIFVYPAPIANLTLFINSWKQLGNISSISATLNFPPGYQLAVESNYAVHACAGYRAVPPEVAMIARQSKAAIKSINVPDMTMRLDTGFPGVKRSGNIITGP